MNVGASSSQAGGARMKSFFDGADWDARGQRWWSHVRVLADDSMEGRDTGSRGYQRAADYVTEQFRKAGLEPAGVDGFRQPVDFEVFQLDEKESSANLILNGSNRAIKLREDAQFGVSSQTAPDLEVEAVFVGYGLEIPELNYSDLAGLDLRGKIAVFFRGGPSSLPTPIKAHYNSPEERNRSLRKAGVVGVISLANPKVPDLPWPRMATGLLLPRMELKEGGPPESRPLPLVMLFNPNRFDLLVEGSGHTVSEIMQGLGGPGPLPRFPLAFRLRSHVKVRHWTATCSNVVGVLRGSDASLRDEYVVGTAHLDHLGIGEPINGDSIYSGAMDNASGIATLIEIARLLRDSGAKPKRSILFLAVTGEEKGLRGSEHFARHPTVSGDLVADLNMDMFLPLFPFTHLEVQGLEESSLGPKLRTIASQAGIETHGAHVPDQVLFIRSDQYNFVKIGVPSLMLSIDYKPGSPEEKIAGAFFRDRYHAPADDTEQPIDLPAAAQFTDLLGHLMLEVANDSPRPTWNPDSFFRKFAR